MINYNNKKFRAVSNTENGEVSSETVFEYFQSENIVTGFYKGGKIIRGQLLAIVLPNGDLDMRYHQVSIDDAIKTGKCYSKLTILTNGKYRLDESWEWTCGDYSKGESVVEEI